MTNASGEKSFGNILQKATKEEWNTTSTASDRILQHRRIGKTPRGKEGYRRDPTPKQNVTGRISEGFNTKDASLNDTGRYWILQEGGGEGVGLLRTVGRWMRMSPLTSTSCLGMSLCRSLSVGPHKHPTHLWLSALAR